MLPTVTRPAYRAIAVLALVLPLAALVAACGNVDKGPEYSERPVETIYNQALAALQAEEYKQAATLFDEVERQHPYSLWATKAQVMAAYSHYMESRYDEAIVALDRFIQLHPAHKDIPYAFYLKGLCYYEQISDVARDQKMTDLARESLRELITRYPGSKYTRDARLKYELTENHLAGKEMKIGRYYHRQGQYLAAINRFKMVIERYQTTIHAPEALHRLAEAYTALGLTEEAGRVAAVLGHNFPGNEWYMDSYEMVAGKQIRKREEASWYQFWSSDDKGPKVRRITNPAPAWYKIWEDDEKKPLPKPEAPTAAKDPTPAAPQDKSEDKPWWKLW